MSSAEMRRLPPIVTRAMFCPRACSASVGVSTTGGGSSGAGDVAVPVAGGGPGAGLGVCPVPGAPPGVPEGTAGEAGLASSSSSSSGAASGAVGGDFCGCGVGLALAGAVGLAGLAGGAPLPWARATAGKSPQVDKKTTSRLAGKSREAVGERSRELGVENKWWLWVAHRSEGLKVGRSGFST